MRALCSVLYWHTFCIRHALYCRIPSRRAVHSPSELSLITHTSGNLTRNLRGLDATGRGCPGLPASLVSTDATAFTVRHPRLLSADGFFFLVSADGREEEDPARFQILASEDGVEWGRMPEQC
eukprot:2439145-Rhodomonas_salina.1